MKNCFSRSLIRLLILLLCLCVMFTAIAYADEDDGYTITVVTDQDGSAEEAEIDGLQEIEEEEVPLSALPMDEAKESSFLVTVIVGAIVLLIGLVVIKVLVERRKDREFAARLTGTKGSR